MSLTGSGPEHPQRVGVPIADLLAGMYGAYGVVSALHERKRTGKGRVVRTSLLAVDRRGARLPGHPLDRGRRGRAGRRQPPPVDLPLRPVHLCRRHDADLVRQRGAVAEAGRGLRPRPVRPRLRHQPRAGRQPRRRDRAGRRDVRRHPHAELLARLAEIGMPAGEVRTLDGVYDWDQTRSQGLVIDVDHPLLGTIEIPGPPIRFDDNAFAGGRSEHLHPPLLGEHNESVRAWLDERTGGDRAHGARAPSWSRPLRRPCRSGRTGRAPASCSTAVLDAGSFVLVGRPRRSPWPSRGRAYAAELEAAAERSRHWTSRSSPARAASAGGGWRSSSASSVPRRLDRCGPRPSGSSLAVERATARAAAAARRAGVRRHAHAGGHRRLPARW